MAENPAALFLNMFLLSLFYKKVREYAEHTIVGSNFSIKELHDKLTGENPRTRRIQ
jgi:hypothetical protein